MGIWHRAQSWIYTKTLAVFQCWVGSSSVSIRQLNATAPQLQNSHAEHQQTTNRNLSRERDMLLKLNFFQLVERCHYRGGILIMIYWIDTHVLKNGNAQCDREWCKMLAYRVGILARLRPFIFSLDAQVSTVSLPLRLHL